MYRKIQTRFPGKCAKCKGSYAPGDFIYWEKGNREKFHALCYGSQSVSQRVESTEVAASEGRYSKVVGDVFDINIADLKSATLDVLDNKQTSAFLDRNFREARTLSEGSSEFGGFTADELRVWLKSGYKADAFKQLTTEAPPIRERRKLIYSDEGEMQIDLMLSGFDEPFLKWTKREANPGLSVDVQLGFRGHVTDAVIHQYERWVARLLYTLETEGYDLDINVFSVASGYLESGYGYSRRMGTVRINVKREGRMTDFARWSVMFSPAGFRGLVFIARLMHNSSMGFNTYSVGGSRENPWDVEFDPEKRKLTIYCQAMAHSFPEEEMDLKARAFLKKFH